MRLYLRDKIDVFYYDENGIVLRGNKHDDFLKKRKPCHRIFCNVTDIVKEIGGTNIKWEPFGNIPDEYKVITFDYPNEESFNQILSETKIKNIPPPDNIGIVYVCHSNSPASEYFFSKEVFWKN